ncbi:MAG: thioredoxin-dependent thiol peroxidase [Polyangiaceae bacterium]
MATSKKTTKKTDDAQAAKSATKRTTKTPAPAKSPKASTAAKAPASSDAPQAAAASRTPSIGDNAPSFSLPNQDGDQVSLASLKGKKVILYFYPKDDTPGCTREACAFNDVLSQITGHGAVVLGVSRDSASAHQRFRKKYSLDFALLTDADGALHQQYGAWGEKSMYGKKTIGPIRTTVLINAQGKVAKVYSPVKVDGHATAVLEALASILGIFRRHFPRLGSRPERAHRQQI